MNGRAPRLATVFVLAAALAVWWASTALAGETSAERLVRTYAPVLKLRGKGKDICNENREQYQPTTVDTVLGNPRVKLVHEGERGSRTIAKAPTATDIAGLGDDYYLDLPGDTLEPGCDYANDFADLKEMGEAPAITYARIATERGWPGFVVQYWFFYYYNQFNDLHEGDWEGMQIAFDAGSPAQALRSGPTEIVLFQHSGGERASWDDEKVEKRGTHPVVYPAAGSHATFYDSAIYIENGDHGSGVGCDNTSEPLRRLRVTAQLVPTHPTRSGPDKWLTYKGHWGQKESGFNTGPTGPITKTVWRTPFSWMQDVRTASPTLPGGNVLGPAASGVFCGAVATVSQFINLQARSPQGALLLALIAIVLILLPLIVTRWRPVDLSELRRPRAFGQLVRTSRQLYGRHWRIFVPIGLSAALIVGAIQGMQWLLRTLTGGDQLSPSSGIGGFKVDLSLDFNTFARPVSSAIVAGAVISAVLMLERKEPLGLVAAYRRALSRFWRLVFGQLLVDVLIVAMLITVVGIPFGIWKFIGWQFVQQEILFKDKSIREAMRGSSRVVRRHWWRTLGIAGFFWLVASATGPVLGFLLIFANVSAVKVNIIGSVVFALLIPFVTIGRTLLYFDLQVRSEAAKTEPTSARRERWRRRLRLAPAR